MDFIRHIFRDLMIYVIPWIIVRTAVYPLRAMDIRLENEYKKKDVGKQTSDKIELPVSVPFPVKIERFQKVSEKGEIKSLFEKWETYVIPFTAARIAEGLTFFTIMRTFQDIFGLTDIFFLLSAIALFGCCCVGAVVAKYFNAVVNDPEALDIKNYLNPSVNKKFFKELELDILGYQVYGYFQTYIMIMGCWYLQPNIIFETALYGFSRVIGVITSQPIYWVGRYAKDYNYDYVKTLQFLVKKIGPLGLLAGARDNCVIEIVVAIILIPLEYLFRFIL